MQDFTFLIVFLIIMTLISIVPRIMRRWHIPAVVAVMLVGMAIGPNSIDLIRVLNHVFGRGYPTEQIYVTIDAIGYLGLIFLMTLAGMEINLRMITLEKRAVFYLSILTFLIPAAAGYLVYGAFEPADKLGKWVYASLFASHSVGIVFPVIKELKVTRTRFGVAVLASTVITDIASLILLAVCIQVKRNQMPEQISGSISIFDRMDPEILGHFFPVIFLITTATFLYLVIWSLPKIFSFIFGNIDKKDDARITFLLAGLLGVVFAGEAIGINAIVSAFIAGMAMVYVPSFHASGRLLLRKMEGIGMAF